MTGLRAYSGRRGPRDDAAPAVLAALLLVTTGALIVACTGFLSIIGADSRWLAALGRSIVADRSIPTGVPYASAPSDHWHNVPVLAELIFHGLEAGLGDRGLLLAQLLALTLGLAFAAHDSTAAGAPAVRTSMAMLLAATGMLATVVVIRAQLFSLALFPLLVALLRSEARHPSRRIVLVLPLLALWSNLHGAVLTGLAVTLAYLLLHRIRAQAAVALALVPAALAAVCVTPALLGTVAYYHGVLTNVAAQRGIGLWAPLSIGDPLDVLTIAAVALLILPLRKKLPPLWEVAAMIGLGAVTIDASRSGAWLLFFAIAPAASAASAASARAGVAAGAPARLALLAVGAVAAAATATAAATVVRGPHTSGATASLVRQAVRLAAGTPVLTDATVAEQVALAGGQIWIGNPIDAFSHRDQAIYLDWLRGAPNGRAALGGRIRIVLAGPGSPAEQLVLASHRFRPLASDGHETIYRRR